MVSRYWKRGVFVMLCLVFWVGAAFAQLQETKVLDRGRWAPHTRAAIQALIDRVGNSSPDYNPAKPPYVVLDWDRTCAFHDCERRLFVYQIDRLAYKMTPQEFAEAIKTGVPTGKTFPEPYRNTAGQPITVEALVEDILSDYQFLYQHYKEFGGSMTLEEIHNTPQFLDFRAKLHFFYRAMKPLRSQAKIMIPWTPFLFVGMTGQEIRDLATQCNLQALGEELGTRVLESPKSLPGKADIVSEAHWLGLRVFPEMTNLMNVLRANGINIYVCTASMADVVRAFATHPEFGYHLSMDQVFGMELERDEKDVVQRSYKAGHPITLGPGKTEMINKALVSHYGYGPVMVAGDSSGDANMMIDFEDLQLAVIMNRLEDGLLGEHCKKAAQTIGQPNPRFVLQGRDENTGLLRPSEKTIPYGKTVKDEQLLK